MIFGTRAVVYDICVKSIFFLLTNFNSLNLNFLNVLLTITVDKCFKTFFIAKRHSRKLQINRRFVQNRRAIPLLDNTQTNLLLFSFKFWHVFKIQTLVCGVWNVLYRIDKKKLWMIDCFVMLICVIYIYL